LAGGVSVYEDLKIIQTDLYMNRYPFTVVYEYTIDESVIYPNRTWMPVFRTKISLENASITYIIPENFTFRYKSANYKDLEPEITPSGRRESQYRWELNNVKAYVHQAYMPPSSYIFPYVQTGPNELIYGGYPGNMETWESFGNWINDLNKDRQNLSDAVIADIKNISESTSDTLEMIRKIYEYMQSRTRYVSIQLGVGGFQPDDVRSVERNAYGDCKALSNFTQALLAVAGIKSHYAWIYNGTRNLELDPDFPYDYFNHAIICVPLQNDTIWLETTSNTIPMGFIGEGNSDRWVLLVTEDGGKLVRTPSVNPDQNIVEQSIQLNAKDNFNIRGEIHQKLTGLAMSNLMGISLIGESRQRDYYTNRIRLNNFQLDKLSFFEEKTPPGQIKKQAEFNLTNYFRRAGERYIFQPVLLTDQVGVPSFSGERKYDFHLNFYLSHIDTISWNLPAGYKISVLPDDFSAESPFGYYSISYYYQPEKETLTILRKFSGKRGKFSPEEWDGFIEFLRNVQQNDRAQLMLVPDS
jgi:hypothetical protein